VRLTAAVALRECVDVRLMLLVPRILTKFLIYQTLDFDANMFAPYIAPAVTELVRIIGEADTMESKRRIAASLNTVITRAEIRVGCMSQFVLYSC
jgi:hypothetical protein